MEPNHRTTTLRGTQPEGGNPGRIPPGSPFRRWLADDQPASHPHQVTGEGERPSRLPKPSCYHSILGSLPRRISTQLVDIAFMGNHTIAPLQHRDGSTKCIHPLCPSIHQCELHGGAVQCDNEPGNACSGANIHHRGDVRGECVNKRPRMLNHIHYWPLSERPLGLCARQNVDEPPFLSGIWHRPSVGRMGWQGALRPRELATPPPGGMGHRPRSG